MPAFTLNQNVERQGKKFRSHKRPEMNQMGSPIAPVQCSYLHQKKRMHQRGGFEGHTRIDHITDQGCTRWDLQSLRSHKDRSHN
jgi:hypothetical protein